MPWRNFFLLLFAVIAYRYHQTLNEEFFFATRDFISKFGYDSEEHVVESADGFVTTLFRVLPKKNAAKKFPVLLEGGMFCSSDLFVMHRNNLAFFLADEGFDVWLGNYRGSKYSKPGPKANFSDPFLDYFGYHEMGVFDFSATIDYVLAETNRDKLNILAVSVGSNSLLALLSTRPEYNDRVNKAVHLGSGFALKMNNWYQKLFFRSLSKASWLFVKSGFLGPWPLRPLVASVLCNHLLSEFCLQLIGESTGLPDGRNTTEAALILTMLPSGSPVGVVDHLLQLSDEGSEFFMRDFGTDENLLRYASRKPPRYDVTRVTVATKVYYAQDDSLVRHKIAQTVFSALPNVIGEIWIPAPFSHINFLTNSGRSADFVRDVLATFSND